MQLLLKHTTFVSPRLSESQLFRLALTLLMVSVLRVQSTVVPGGNARVSLSNPFGHMDIVRTLMFWHCPCIHSACNEREFEHT